MTKRQTPARVLASALVTTWIVVGCVPVDPTASGGAGGEGGGATTTLEGTDAQVCGAACQSLLGCGADLDQTGCKTDCLDPANANLVTCFRNVDATCDSLATCVWRALCAGTSPSGSGTCEAGQQCAVTCGGSPDLYCLCGCEGQLASNVSSEFYVLVTCLSVHCNIECGTGGDPVSCDSCIAGECSAADAQCN